MRKYNAKIWRVLYKNKKNKNWNYLKGDNGYWYADPILINYNGKKYLFTEAFKMLTQIGQIAVSEYSNDCFSKPKIIMKRLFHMSYPCIFLYNDELFMIPETSQNGTLELWRCKKNNIYDWHKIKVLKRNVRYADNTIYNWGGVIKFYYFLMKKILLLKHTFLN